jgi:hypothetical protein
VSAGTMYPVVREGLAGKADLVFLMSRARVALRLDMPCPHCHVARGCPCVTPDGHYVAIAHARRGKCIGCC